MPAARRSAPCHRHCRGRTRPIARRASAPGPMKIIHAVRYAKFRRAAFAVIAAALAVCPLISAGSAANAKPETHRRMVIIDQDAFGPAGSNLQAILMLLQASDVDVLGITIVSGDGWRDEEVDHTLRLLEIAERTDVPVIPGAVLPLVNSAARTKAWESLYGKLYYKGAWTEHWPDQGVARRTPHPQDPYLVPPPIS